MEGEKVFCKDCYYYNDKWQECRRFPPALVMVMQEIGPGINLELRGGMQQKVGSAPRVQYGFPKVVPDKWYCGEWDTGEEYQEQGGKG